ncbi:MAG: hypothetical protein PF508_16785 [Spirochaeta sp.]|jgi:tetratricopeptide (TPR) repeat protein|nr:hypothetical protein [Spirochaeta sp.]
MQSRRRFHRYFLLAIVLFVLAVVGCVEENDARLEFLTQTESGAYEGIPVDDERVEELRRDITRYEEEISETVQNYRRVASFQKSLAQELIRGEMYGPALEALERAMDLQSENAVLYYFAGVAAARSARGHILDGEETDYLSRAERLFGEALALRPDYKDALFAMAVLLAFDLQRPEEALEYSRRLSQLETGDPGVRFLHANVLVRNGMVDEAIAVYDDLAQTAPGTDQRARARENRDALRGRSER